MSESIQPALCKFSSTRIFQLQRLTFVFLQTSSLLKKRHWVLFSLYRVFMSSAKVYQRIVNSCQCFMTLHDYKNSVKRTFFHYNTSIPFKTVVFCFKPSTFLPAFMTWNKWRTPQFHDTLFDRKAERLNPRHVKALCKVGHQLLCRLIAAPRNALQILPGLLLRV